MTAKWPCPCCGHLTLAEGPGDYELCPVCYWEDDGGQLRWPLSDDGANGISLVEAQGNYQRYGACSAEFRKNVRRPRGNEPVEAGWRPIDLSVDEVEREPTSAVPIPWPDDATRLYWWRDSYYRAKGADPVNLAPRAEEIVDPSPAERLMARVLEAVPEARVVEEAVRHQFETPAPFAFCHGLVDLALGAFESGDHDLPDRLLNALNTGLTDGDPFAHNCASIAFLEDSRWHAVELEAFIARWPNEIRREITRQRQHAARTLAEAPNFVDFNREWEALRSTASDLAHPEVRHRVSELSRSHGMP